MDIEIMLPDSLYFTFPYPSHQGSDFLSLEYSSMSNSFHCESRCLEPQSRSKPHIKSSLSGITQIYYKDLSDKLLRLAGKLGHQ